MSASKIGLAAITVTTLLGLGLGSTAVAQTTTFSGLDCVESGDVQPEILYSSGRALNDNTTYDAVFECPITRLDSNLSGNLSSIYARVLDNHPGTSDADSVGCRAFSCNLMGQSCYVSGTFFTNGMGNSSLYLGSLSTHSTGTAYLRCDVPDFQNGHSGVVSYRVTD